MGEEGQSVRGRGWVKFEEEGEGGGQRVTPQRSTENEESPGSLEVSGGPVRSLCLWVSEGS